MLDDIDDQAKFLLQTHAPLSNLKRFLREVPWHLVQQQHSSSSRPLKEENATSTVKPSAYVIVGAFTYGGVVGITRTTRRLPWTTRVLTKVLRLTSPGIRTTSICVSCNVQSPPHRDRWNILKSQNVVVSLEQPSTGGELWVERRSPFSRRCQKNMTCGNQTIVGDVHQLRQPVVFEPKQWHHTLPWVGNRMVLVGYSTCGFSRMSPEDVTFLRTHGFSLPFRNAKPSVSAEHQALISQDSEVPFGLSLRHEQQHGPGQPHEVRASAQAVGVWRAGSVKLDEDPVESSPGRASGRAEGDCAHEREGRCQDGEQVQDQGGPPEPHGQLSGGLHEPHELRPAEEQDGAVLDGESGTGQQSRLHGLRQVRFLDIRGDPGVQPELHKVVPGDSDRNFRVPLEVEALRSLEQRDRSNREESDRDLVPQSGLHRSQDDEQGLQQSPGSLELNGNRGVVEHSNGGPRDDPGRDSVQNLREQPDPRPRGAGAPAPGSHEDQGHASALRQDQEDHRAFRQVDPPEWVDSVDSDFEHRDDICELEGEFVHPGELCRLPFGTAKQISKDYEGALLSTVKALGSSHVVLLEVGGSEDSVLGKEVEKICGSGAVVRLSFWNGGDLGTLEGRKYIRKTLEEVCPRFVWIYGDSSAYSPVNKMNQRTPQQALSLQAKKESASRSYEGVVDILRASRSTGATCVLEMADACEAWDQSWYVDVEKECLLYKGICQGCQVNRRDFQGSLLCRGWGLASSDGALIQHMSLMCDGRHSKSRNPMYASRHSPEYPREFARRVARYFERCETWFETARQLQTPAEMCLVTSGAETQEELSPAPTGLQDIPAADRKRIFRHLHQIHTATGHCSVQYMRSHLKRRGANAMVMRCLDHFRCDACAERARPDPRSPSTLVEVAPKWHTLQCDAFSWNHPESGEKWQFLLGVDEGSRLRVGRLLFQHASKTPSAQDFIDYFEGHWLPHFGKPNVLRLDPAGCFRSKGLDTYLADRSVEVTHIPAEAHWQISIVERSIQSVKAMMSALVSENPSMSISEAFYRALWASNHRDQHRGYSPLQHAFGRSPDELGHLGESKMRDVPILTEHGISAEFGRDVKAMCTAEKAFLEEQARERLRRAELSGSRVMKHFCPGDLVFAWRRMTPKQDGSKHFKGGKFVGPYRVLATETRVDEHGSLRAGHVVWLYRGGQLVKAAPQQLRPATDREESWNELVGGTPIPWTISETLRKQPPHQYEDISPQAHDMPSTALQEEMETEHEIVPRRISGKRRVSEILPQNRMKSVPREPKTHRSRLQELSQSTGARTPRSRSSHPSQSAEDSKPTPSSDSTEELLGELFGEDRDDRSRSPQRVSAAASQRALERADFLEEFCGVSFPEEECAFWGQEGAAVSFSVGLPRVNTKQGREWVRDLGCFFSKQLRRNAVEISERHLSSKELEGFRGAKQKEVKNFIVARAFQKLPDSMRPSYHQILKMRWILTWKLDDDPKGEPLKKDSAGNPLKPKARAVVLGYMDPQYEFRPTSSPTMSRTTRQIFLQKCADYKFKVEKGDISGAFLQGDEFGPERSMVCEPLPEICEALGVSKGSPMLLTKAAYGLVEAPIQWFLSVSRFLESLGGERQFSDPCCWGFFRKDRTPIGWVCGHVDDFLFGGSGSEWDEIREKIKSRFKWGQWESGRFLQCGVLIEQDEKGFLLSQPEYLDSVGEIHVGRQRALELDSPINQQELMQLRSVLGALSWHATQVAPQWSSSVSLLLSKIHKGSVSDIIETNKLLRKAKLSQHQKLRIHGQGRVKPLLAAWVDAADSNRIDGSSTKGVFIGWTHPGLLAGDLASITPIVWQSAKIQRACRSSAAAETRAAVDAEDELYAVRFQTFEFEGGHVNVWRCDDAVRAVNAVLISDSKNLYDRLGQTVLTLKGAEKRTDIETLCLKESTSSTDLVVRWVNGDSQLANSLTKENELHQIHEFLRRGGQWRIVFDPNLLSGRKRRQLGIDTLENIVPASESDAISSSKSLEKPSK